MLSFASITITLFLLMDSIGNVPIFLSLLKPFSMAKKRRIIMREMLIALAILIVFFAIGDAVLDALSVDSYTVYIAGGLILLMIALRMIFPTAKNHTVLDKEPLIVPMAIPLLAGPATLATIMLYSHDMEMAPSTLFLAILTAWSASAIILLCGSFLERVLGPKGLEAGERLMGLVLTLIAIQMILAGTKTFLTLS